jgi:hypothetical protein
MLLNSRPYTTFDNNSSDYAKLNWLTRANPYLAGPTPIQALKAGQQERVLAEAAAAEASQWS